VNYSQYSAISAEVGTGMVLPGCAMKTASNSGCSCSPGRKTLNIPSCIAVPPEVNNPVLSGRDSD
jgi:hypothetical protein